MKRAASGVLVALALFAVVWVVVRRLGASERNDGDRYQ
jgi:hypothetical protein